MKGLVSLLLKQFHLLILLNTGLAIQGNLTQFEEQMRELKSQAEDLSNRIRTQIQKNKAIKEFERNLEDSKERIKEVATQIDSVQKQLPNTIQDTEILEFFSREANSMNIKEIFLAPIKEEKRDFYFGKQYQFKGVGTFLQFMIFFEKVGEGDRLLNVRSLSLAKKKGKQKGRFQLLDIVAVMEAFRYNPDFQKEEALLKNVETGNKEIKN